jgi:hypothetical protein
MPSFTVPAACSDYTTINDSTRLVSYTATTSLCDRPFFSSTLAWVRFIAPGGTQMPTFASGPNRCGAWATGWMDGAVPAIGALANVHVCWTINSNCSYRDPLHVAHCLDYYVYGVQAPGACSYRYCTI